MPGTGIDTVVTRPASSVTCCLATTLSPEGIEIVRVSWSGLKDSMVNCQGRRRALAFPRCLGDRRLALRGVWDRRHLKIDAAGKRIGEIHALPAGLLLVGDPREDHFLRAGMD